MAPIGTFRPAGVLLAVLVQSDARSLAHPRPTGSLSTLIHRRLGALRSRAVARCGESERFVWDGTIDDEAHLGLADDDDDDDEPFVGVAAAESHTPALAPPGWDDNECSLEELFEDLEEGDWGARAPPVGGFAAPRNADAASFAPRAGLIADWEVDEEAHLHDAD